MKITIEIPLSHEFTVGNMIDNLLNDPYTKKITIERKRDTIELSLEKPPPVSTININFEITKDGMVFTKDI